MATKKNTLNVLLNSIEENKEISSVINSLLNEKIKSRDVLQKKVKNLLRKALLSNEENKDYLNLSSDDFPVLILATGFKKLTVKSYLKLQLDWLVMYGKISVILPRKGWAKFYEKLPQEVKNCLNATIQSQPSHFKQSFSTIKVPADKYIYLELELLWH